MSHEIGNAWLRLRQLHGQIDGLARCLDTLLPAAHSEPGPSWLPAAVASMVSEVAGMIPDAKYFRSLSEAGVNMKAFGSVVQKLETLLDIRCVLALASAAIEDVFTDQPQEPFGFAHR